MKTKSEIEEQIENYNTEITELAAVREHCASMKWWSVVNELKKVENIRSRDKRLLESLLT